MLAESALEWTRQWKQEGYEEGLEKVLGEARAVLVDELERRFGPLSETAKGNIGAITSIRELMDLRAQAATAPSLGALGLD